MTNIELKGVNYHPLCHHHLHWMTVIILARFDVPPLTSSVDSSCKSVGHCVCTPLFIHTYFQFWATREDYERNDDCDFMKCTYVHLAKCICSWYAVQFGDSLTFWWNCISISNCTASCGTQHILIEGCSTYLCVYNTIQIWGLVNIVCFYSDTKDTMKGKVAS